MSDPSEVSMRLSPDEQAMLEGESGPGTQLAMKLVVTMSEAQGADHLIDISAAHIDGCLYHGQSGIDFAKTLLDGGAAVKVPTTLNVASIDMLHPELYRGDAERARKSRELTDTYVGLGCSPTWTCAPYQLSTRPAQGDQVVWGESNAIVFANSVLGARTNRYGDFIDICCAVTAKAPAIGLHTDSGRMATIEVVVDLADHVLDSDMTYPLIGYVIGGLVGSHIPAIVGLDDRATEDRLKSLGAAAASSGAVAMFHAVGVTPEAADNRAAFGEREPVRRVELNMTDLHRARVELTTGSGALGAVSLGTPHMSLTEMRALASLAEPHITRVPFYVNTSRDVLAAAQDEGLSEGLGRFGATMVTDTCTYISPIMADVEGSVMTDSAKWAHYAPANLGVDVILGSMAECVASAAQGELVMDEDWQ